MKKLIITTAIILGFGLTTFADPNGGGMFQRGTSESEFYGSGWRAAGDMPALPNHGLAENQDAPLGTGIAVLTVLGAAYLVGKKRREE
jgi:hypothetical protein